MVVVHRHALKAGDYSLLGYEDRISIERKSLNDLVGTVINERDRFYRELEKLTLYQDAAIVVEANLCDITAKKYTANVSFEAVLGAVFSIQSQFRLPFIFAGDRAHAALAVVGMLWQFSRKVEK